MNRSARNVSCHSNPCLGGLNKTTNVVLLTVFINFKFVWVIGCGKHPININVLDPGVKGATLLRNVGDDLSVDTA